jgi:hypothetical protein
MKYDENEIQNYTLGSDLWAGDQDPILKYGVNEETFWKYVLLRSKGFARHLDSENNRATAVAVYIQRFGTPVIASELSELILKLISIQYSGFTDPNAAPAELADTRPRDRNGRLMSPKAIQWQEWEAWVSNPETSMKQVEALRQSNPEFREFFSTISQKQRPETPLAQYDVLNANRDPDGSKLPDEVYTWAAQCPTLPVDELRRIMSPGAVYSRVANENKRLFDIAVAANLL